MSTINDDGHITLQATAVAITKGLRVTYDSAGKILASGAANDAIGVALEDIAASGWGTVKLFSAPGTFFVVAGAAVARGAALHAIAAGKVDDAGANLIGMIALEAATADGDIIPAAPTR